MILCKAEQGTPAWLEDRKGIPTASMFHRVVMPGGEPRFKKNGEPYKSRAGELAEGRWTYAYELVGERLLNESKQTLDGLQWVERGKLLESDAVELFESTYGPTAKCGFILTDDKRYGCSPDRLLCDSLGGLELKCPGIVKHLEYFDQGPGADYKAQVQGAMLVTGFPHWDFMSYHPQLPEVLIRFERDEEFIAKLASGLDQFCDEVDALVEKVKAAGYVPPPKQFIGPVEMAYRDVAWEGSDAVDLIIATGNWGG